MTNLCMSFEIKIKYSYSKIYKLKYISQKIHFKFYIRFLKDI